jgi:DNA-binding NarL/FixJ family response regulator
MRILLADDHSMVRQGLRALLEREGFSVVAEAADGPEAVEMAAEQKPDVAILDVVMPRLSGVQAAREIQGASPHTKTVLVSMQTDHRHVIEGMRSGARAYVLKSDNSKALVEAVRQVARGNTYLSPAVARMVALHGANGHSNGSPLTAREREVLKLIAEGSATKEVAAVLGLSVKTAESHRARIMEKLGIHETANLVRYAIRNGIIVA